MRREQCIHIATPIPSAISYTSTSLRHRPDLQAWTSVATCEAIFLHNLQLASNQDCAPIMLKAVGVLSASPPAQERPIDHRGLPGKPGCFRPFICTFINLPCTTNLWSTQCNLEQACSALWIDRFAVRCGAFELDRRVVAETKQLRFAGRLFWKEIVSHVQTPRDRPEKRVIRHPPSIYIYIVLAVTIASWPPLPSSTCSWEGNAPPWPAF